MLYRNFLAMETEELLRSHPIDGAILLGGCDKTTPGLVMGAVSMGHPDDFPSGRSDAARSLGWQEPQIGLGLLELLGRKAGGQIYRSPVG